MLSIREVSFDIKWDNLINLSSTATFFQTKEWLTLWLKHFPIKEKILGVFDGEELVGIAPFSIDNQKIDLLGVTTVLGEELVSDFGDIIAIEGREKEVWEAALEGIRDQGSGISLLRPETRQLKPFLEFNFIREDSPSFKILQELGGKAEEMDVAPYIDLPKSWEDHLASLDRHNRHELRRKMRKLGNVTVTKGNLSDIDEFFRLMTLGNEQKRNFLKPEIKGFFQDVITLFLPKDMLEISFLEYEGRKIAAVLIFIFHNEVLLYNSGFNPKYSHLSPGLILKAYAIKEAIEKGRKKFDFLRGGERYKYDLGGKERKLYRIRII